MKKVFTFCFVLLLVSVVASFCVNAADYTYEDMKISVPDFLVNDAQWASESDFEYAFSDSDVNIELNISVYENEEYSYEGLDEDNFSDYAELLKEKYDTGDYSPLKSVNVSSYVTEEKVYGIRSDIIFEEEQYVFYWFATEKNCYDLNFYIYNTEYLTYVDQIIGTLMIGTPVENTEPLTPTEEAGETVPVLSDEDVIADGDGRVEDDGKLPSVTDNLLPIIFFVVALVLLILLLVVKKKKNVKTQISPQPDVNDGIYYDPNTGNYFKTVSADDGVAPGQRIGYIYYPVQTDNSKQNNNSTQN